MHLILNVYDKNIFKNSENFLEICFPFSQDYLQSIQDTPQDKEQENKGLGDKTPQATHQATPQVEKIIQTISGAMSREELQTKLNLSDKKNFIEKYQKPALEMKFIEMTIPGTPNSPKQKYRLTEKGKQLKKQFESKTD